MGNENKREVKNFSSIQVSRESKERLKALALTPRESYENILLRLLNVKLGNREIVYTIQQKNTDCSIDCVVDWSRDKENIMFFNKDGDRKFRFPVSCEGVSDDVWSNFKESVLNSDNLIANLSILDIDEEIEFGDLVLKRGD